MAEETEIYTIDDIRITNLRAVFGQKTYSIANITSVEAQEVPANGCAVIFIVFLGIAFIIGGASGSRVDWGVLIIGVLFAAGGVYGFANQKPTHSVTLTTAGGEVKAYTSTDKSVITKIVEALNTAIIQKG